MICGIFAILFLADSAVQCMLTIRRSWHFRAISIILGLLVIFGLWVDLTIGI